MMISNENLHYLNGVGMDTEREGSQNEYPMSSYHGQSFEQQQNALQNDGINDVRNALAHATMQK